MLVHGDARTTTDPATAGVVARPPLLFLTALLLGLVLDHLLPLPLPVPQRGLLRAAPAVFLILAGLALAGAGIHNFTREATPVPTNQPVRALVMTGIHGRSRNPIYLGLLFAYVGVGIAARSPWALVLTVPLGLTVRRGVVAREEAYLERRFGEAYRDYKARVRRWL